MLELPVGFGEMTPVWHLDGDAQDMTFSIGYRADPFSDDPGDLGAAGGLMVADYVSQFAAAAGDILEGWSLERCNIRFNSTASGVVTLDIPVNVVGTDPAQSPLNVSALLVQKRTAVGGREHRGRVFEPPFAIDEGGVDNVGYVDPAILTNKQTAWDEMVTGSGGWQAVLLHSDPLTAPDDITAYVVKSRLARQNRRYKRA